VFAQSSVFFPCKYETSLTRAARERGVSDENTALTGRYPGYS
jgi:hypothetical protein